VSFSININARLVGMSDARLGNLIFAQLFKISYLFERLKIEIKQGSLTDLDLTLVGKIRLYAVVR
jgi:hypothetical protein